MKRIIMCFLAVILTAGIAIAQDFIASDGTCGTDVAWSFDGKTLTITNVSKKEFFVTMNDYDTQKMISPWNKKKLNVRSVRIGAGVRNIGACAFANCKNLTEVVFENSDVQTIGWGAFLNCERLVTISLPNKLRTIGTVAFANCKSLPSVIIPDQCQVQDQAYLNCSGIRSIEVSPTATLGQYVFASEVTLEGKVRHTLYNDEVRRLPISINSRNCHFYGFAKGVLERYQSGKSTNQLVDYDYMTSHVDSFIPEAQTTRNDTYALIIGNQNYRFVSEVPFAIHDARVFRDYCQKTLGIPAEHIHICEDATKQLILEDELVWLEGIKNRENKKLIIYYAGHGVPDTKKQNKAYLLPTDVRGTKPENGIALDDFYARLGDLAFSQTSVFLDACFSGINRDNESVNEGMRAVEIAAEEGNISSGNVVVFSAAQGNETAQGIEEEGHGLFTYYLLRALQSTTGFIDYGDLADQIRFSVSRKATQLKLRKPQTPNAAASEQLGDAWRDLTF